MELTFCEDCQTQVRDCEHVKRSRKIAKMGETEAGRENDVAYLDSRCYELWLIVNAEDLGRFIPSREESDRASAELDRLLEKHHHLTRRPTCDCHTCCKRGWHLPKPKAPADKPKLLSEWFRVNPYRADWMDAPDPWLALHIVCVRDGIIMPDGSCGPMCICGACMEKSDDAFSL